MWVGDNLLIVLRATRHVITLPRPCFTAVFTAVKPTLVVGRFDDRVENIGVDRRDRQTDATDIATGQAPIDGSPSLSAIGGLVQTRFGAAVKQRPNMTTSLVGSCIKCVWVARI